MKLTSEIREEMLAHAREDLPNECCGLLGGGSDRVPRTLYKASNAEASPLRYSLDAKDQFRIMQEMEEAGEELVGIYHSHTKSAAYPSQTDINLATYPGAAYLIVSLAEGEEQPIRAFEIVDGEVAEIPLDQ
jgi:proteasome lid subunit RPN8/RPN11